MRVRDVFLSWILVVAAISPLAAQSVSFDIIYVRQTRFGDNANTTWPEVFHPGRLDPGADLMLLHPDGTEEVLVAGGHGGVTDPFLSFDAQWCYYSFFPDLRTSELNYQRDFLPYAGADIYRIHLRTRRIQRLTFQEFTPNTAAGDWDESNPVDPPSANNRLGYGILNLGPCPVPGGKIAFTSNRNGFIPTKSFTSPAMQLFVMDDDGENVEAIAPMSFGSALHPTILRNGELMFSSYESQGLRDSRLWGIWAIQPDGRAWRPILSAFNGPQAFHFMTQLSNTDLVVVDYYNLNNNGFGALYRLPVDPPSGQPYFRSAFADLVPLSERIQRTVGDGMGFSWPLAFPFMPRGIYSLTPFTLGDDSAAPVGTGGTRVGKFTHPSAAPNNDLLVVWTPGPANDLNRPTTIPYYDAGLYLMHGGNVANSPADLVLIKNDPNYNEAWPRAVVPYRQVHGVYEPTKLPWLPNNGAQHSELPAGTPYGLIGTSSFYKRESFPGLVRTWANTFNGLDAFNTDENEQSSNWFTQGSDAGKYANSDIFAVRILAMEANSHRSYGPNEGFQFANHASERLRILGEIPLRKFNEDGSPVLDPEGNPDTSFLAKIPADTPFTFQTIDRDGIVLNMAQTWHQVRPGEVRNNCGGCHAHSQRPLSFASTHAGQPGRLPTDITTQLRLLVKDAGGNTVAQAQPRSRMNVEFLRDIRPILERSCVSCHNATNPNNAQLDLSDHALYQHSDRYRFPYVPGDYKRLADDATAQWGPKPVVASQTWRQTNASRYVRMFQSRRSLLVWKIFGRRLDGWRNSDHPTETTPGNRATLPVGPGETLNGVANRADLDYVGDPMPPPGSGVPMLSEDEKMTIARWIDLGCPINVGELDSASAGKLGWFLDENRPTLTVSSPRPNLNAPPLTEIRIGAADAHSGLNHASLSVKADFAVNGQAPNAELSGLGTWNADQSIFILTLNPEIGYLPLGHLTVSIADHADGAQQGNVTRKRVRFCVLPDSLEIVDLDPTQPNQAWFCVIDTSGSDAHDLKLSTDLTNWSPMSILTRCEESLGRFRFHVQLPAATYSRGFLKAERP